MRLTNSAVKAKLESLGLNFSDVVVGGHIQPSLIKLKNGAIVQLIIRSPFSFSKVAGSNRKTHSWRFTAFSDFNSDTKYQGKKLIHRTLMVAGDFDGKIKGMFFINPMITYPDGTSNYYLPQVSFNPIKGVTIRDSMYGNTILGRLSRSYYDNIMDVIDLLKDLESEVLEESPLVASERF